MNDVNRGIMQWKRWISVMVFAVNVVLMSSVVFLLVLFGSFGWVPPELLIGSVGGVCDMHIHDVHMYFLCLWCLSWSELWGLMYICGFFYESILLEFSWSVEIGIEFLAYCLSICLGFYSVWIKFH